MLWNSLDRWITVSEPCRHEGTEMSCKSQVVNLSETREDDAVLTSRIRDPKQKKFVGRAAMPPDQRLLVDRRDAAQYLSISQRSLDYLLASGDLDVRRIGSRVLIPLPELQRYAGINHKRLVG